MGMDKLSAIFVVCVRHALQKHCVVDPEIGETWETWNKRGNTGKTWMILKKRVGGKIGGEL